MDYDIDLLLSSETVVSARIQSQPGEIVWGLVKPDEDLQVKSLDGLLVGRVLVNTVDQERVPVCILNLACHPKRIKKGMQIIAKCYAVETPRVSYWKS